MKHYRIVFSLLMSVCLMAGCVASTQQQPTPETVVQQPSPDEVYIQEGEALESQGNLTSALEQYNLALTAAPDNSSAASHKKQVEEKLYNIAQGHYQTGLAFDEQGKYDSARRAYLSALQNWPDLAEAKEKLSPGGVSLDSDQYIVHTILEGQSVSRVSKLYYGDINLYPVIGKFNSLEDVTKIRAGDKLKIPAINGLTITDLQERLETYMKEQQAEGDATAREQAAAEETEPKMPGALPPEVPQARETEPAREAGGLAGQPEILTGDQAASAGETAAPETAEPAAPAVETPQQDTTYDQAMVFFEQKEYAKAIPLFETALASNAGDETITGSLFESHFQQGLSQFKTEQYLEAKESFASAFEYNASCSKCNIYIQKCEDTYKEKHYNLGIHYFGKEQLKQAITEWELVEKIDPDYKDVQSNLNKAQSLYERLESIRQNSRPQ